MADFIVLNGRQISHAQLKAGQYQPKNTFEETTLTFCRAWLNGTAHFMQKTSGSTGQPKEITLTRAQMQYSAHQTMRALNLPKNAKALVCIDTAYIGGKMMLVRGFDYGMQLHINTPSANPLLHTQEHFDFTAMVPMQLQQIWANPETRPKLAGFKAIILGGNAVPHALAQKLATQTIPIYSTYGMTETASHIALQRLSKPTEPYFRGIGDVKFTTTPDNRLQITGTVTALKTLTTNDIVALQSPHQFSWLGRADNVINSGGIKLHPEVIEQEIEKIFIKNKLNYRFFVAGHPDDLLGQKLVLYIESHKKALEGIIKPLLSKGLTKYHQPKEIRLAFPFIETPTGKINRLRTVKKYNTK